jgi:hypothetical protein
MSDSDLGFVKLPLFDIEEETPENLSDFYSNALALFCVYE